MKKYIVFMVVSLCSAVLFAGEGPKERTLLEERAEALKKEREQQQKEERQRVDEEVKLHEQQQKEAQAAQSKISSSEFERQKSAVLDIWNQFSTAYKHYESNRSKEGDAAILKIDGKDLLSVLSAEQLATIVRSLKPEPEARFMMLGQLAGVNAHRGTVLSERPTLVRLIVSLLESLQVADLQKLFAQGKTVQTLHDIAYALKPLVKEPMSLMPQSPAEELFYGMVTVIQNLVAVLKKAPEYQKISVVRSLLEWVEVIPKKRFKGIVQDLLKDVPVRFFSTDYDAAREMLALLKDSEDEALQDLKVSVLRGALKKGTVDALREALKLSSPLPIDSKDPLFPLVVAVENNYLKAVATQRGLRQFVADDTELIIESLSGLTEKDPLLVAGPLAYLVRDVSNMISTLQAESKGKDLTAERKKILKDRVNELEDLQGELPTMILPDHKLPAAIWEDVVARIKKAKTPFNPVFLDWEPERLQTYLFLKSHDEPVDAGASFRHFAEVYMFYKDFPEIQKQLLNEAIAHYNKALNGQEMNQFLEVAGSDEALLRFMYVDPAGLTLFGKDFLDGFKQSLYKRALYKAAANNRRPLLNVIPLLFKLSDVVDKLLSYKEGQEILYKLLADVPDNQFATFIYDLKKPAVFGVNNLPVLLKAVPYLKPERAKLFIDAMEAAKDEFYYVEHLKPLEKWSDFSVTQTMLNEATAAYKKNLKQEQEKAKKSAVAKQ